MRVFILTSIKFGNPISVLYARHRIPKTGTYVLRGYPRKVAAHDQLPASPSPLGILAIEKSKPFLKFAPSTHHRRLALIPGHIKTRTAASPHHEKAERPLPRLLELRGLVREPRTACNCMPPAALPSEAAAPPPGLAHPWHPLAPGRRGAR